MHLFTSLVHQVDQYRPTGTCIGLMEGIDKGWQEYNQLNHKSTAYCIQFIYMYVSKHPEFIANHQKANRGHQDDLIPCTGYSIIVA